MTPPPPQGSGGRGQRGGGKSGGKGGQQPRGGSKGGQQPRGGGKGGGKGGQQPKGGGGKAGGRGRTGGGQRTGGGARRPPQDERVAELAKPLQRVLERIPATQREVLEWRMGLKDGHPHDLSSTAEQLGLSITETREIEQRAFEHIREVVPLAQLQKFLGGG